MEGLARAATWRRLSVFGLMYAAGLAILPLTPLARPVVSVAAIGFGVTAVALAARSRAVSATIGGIGRRTLPIYVLHMPVLAILHAVLVEPVSGADPAMRVLLTVAVTWICLVLECGLPAPLLDLPARKSVVPGA
ncbi:hypothetical protein [Dactylosporangium sp. NPDC000521]|uniref:hypothetical protein n=1 Tax=Dactylosporangium sp. NPDC000521 TaxID=3363975 RepID=UPI00369EF70D